MSETSINSSRKLNDRYWIAIQFALDAHKFFDKQAAKIPNHATLPTGEVKSIACKESCSWCCHQHVTLTASEVLNIVRVIRESNPEIREQLADNVNDEYPKARGKSHLDRERHKVRCPLLGQDGNCSIYDARPITCRAYVSFDRQKCIDGFLNNTKTDSFQSATLYTLRDDILRQVLKNEAAIGISPGTFELIQALRLFINRPNMDAEVVSGGSALEEAKAY